MPDRRAAASAASKTSFGIEIAVFIRTPGPTKGQSRGLFAEYNLGPRRGPSAEAGRAASGTGSTKLRNGCLGQSGLDPSPDLPQNQAGFAGLVCTPGAASSAPAGGGYCDASNRKILCGLALTGLVARLASAGGDYTDTSERWEKAYNAGDAVTVAALYTEDGVVMPPNAGASTGRKAIQAFIEKDLAANKGNMLEIESVESSKSGDLGFARGTWRMKDPSGKILDEGKWIEVRKMVDGQWRIHRDIWNSDRPLPPR